MYSFTKNKKYIVLDVETDGVNPHKDSLVSIAFYSNGRSKFIPIYHPENERLPKECIEEVKKIISKADIIVGHNIKFDLKFLLANGIDEWIEKDVWDTGIAEYIITGQQTKFPKLSDLIQKYSESHFKIDLELSETKASEYSLNILEEYNIRDVEITDYIFKQQLKKCQEISDRTKNLIFISSNFSKVLADIEFNGVKIDTDKLYNKTKQLKEEIDKLVKKTKELCGYDWINFNSSEQLSAVLFGGTIKIEGGYNLRYKTLKNGQLKMYKKKSKCPVVIEGLGFTTKYSEKTKNGYWSVSDSVIKQLKGRTKKQKEFIQTYKLWRKLQTLYEKFFDKYQQYIQDGFIYANFNQTSTNTGRLSCNSPNIQQIPRADEEVGEFNIKEVFISRYPDGVLIECDFSQLEWRVCAYLCQDQTMIDEIKNGIDAHKKNASISFNIPQEEVTKQQRQIAKMVSFGLIYGQTAYGLSKRPDIPIDTEEEAQKIIDTVYTKYSNLKRWHDKLYFEAMKSKKLVSPSGRWFPFVTPEKQITNIKNYPVQSLATADIVPLVLWRAWQKIRKENIECKVINTVHDCIIIDCVNMITATKVAKIIIDFMRKSDILLKKYLGINFNVPLDGEVEVGKNWAEMEEMEVKDV